MAQYAFPQGFIWGAATSAQQVEGAVRADGRGESIWDRFAAESGRIADGSRPDTACDHYRLWRQDIALMAQLGLGGYRFSVAWPRVIPRGRGPVNSAGLDFYDALVDGLVAAGIEPFPTLYHWDLPQPLQDRGGWADRATVDAFADYAQAVTRRLGDRVKRWVTHNEPWCIVTLGHEEGHHAPGLKDPRLALKVAHHVLLSHGRAVPVIRSEVPGAEVGLVHIQCPAMPLTGSEGDRDAARWFDGFFNRWYLEPVFKGRYPHDAIADRIAAGHLSGPEMPFVQDGDLAEISAPLDFLGLNYYSRSVMRTTPAGKREAVPMGEASARTDMDWEVYPDGLCDSLIALHRQYAPRAIYITENGAAYDDPVDADGRIRDVRRIDYLRRHLLAVHRAIGAGVPVGGYFAWSLLDNFEWGHGYEKKFGLCAVEAETHRRLPKDSAGWYRRTAAANAVTDSGPALDAVEPISQGESRAQDV